MAQGQGSSGKHYDGKLARRFVLGVDGGGTKTLCVALSEDGTLLGRGEGGPANPYSYGMERAFGSITASVEGALAQAARAVGPSWPAGAAGADSVASAIYLGISGVDRPMDVEEVGARVAAAGWARHAVVCNDAVIALAAGLRGRRGPGVVVISGTGSVVYGTDAAGRTGRAGGWGPFLGDEGSGYDIGRRALIAVVRADDGRDRPTNLTALARQELGFDRPEDLIGMVYGHGGQPPMEKHAVARLTGIVALAAADGDPVAVKILEEAAAQLAQGVAAVARQLGFGAVLGGTAGSALPVVVTGGVFRAGGEVFTKAFERDLAALRTGDGLAAQVVWPSVSPAAGAALMALGALGVDLDQVTLDPRLKGRDL